VPGVEIEAICKAARSVSGDYYDFIQLSPTHIAIAIADISGKGISAALLMASLQAALRSQMLSEGSERLSMVELVSRLTSTWCATPATTVRDFLHRDLRQRHADAALYECRPPAGFSDLQMVMRSNWIKVAWCWGSWKITSMRKDR